ncbi:unconventional prefoldin RPB5 interactor-like protein isoform X2 [Colletes gigas]|uniref:unconventional prefoldin RPB5 interactor-like protein isoform X2 n=1 Tax=Colletes gigas TaxID=935657 RepID=UPI001C9AFF7E|nr:unconventional prefoldin RPB5 interactor-like protein isoform X2 [Colletes gigas]
MNVGESQNFQHLLLDQVFLKGIQQNEQLRKVWTAYRNGHLKVSEALQVFQKDVHVNCMVPIGKRALMKGKLVHTNEVLVCLGDGYFVKYSASGAEALCKRRIQEAEETLKNLDMERDLYETRMAIKESNLFEDCSSREIVEHWNKDQVEEWKKKHRVSEREYNKKLAKLRQEEQKKIQTEEDLFHRLDQLEIEEELADEFNRLEDERYQLLGEESYKEGEEEEEEEELEEEEEEEEEKEEEELELEEEEEEEFYEEAESSSESEKEDSKQNETPISTSERNKKEIGQCKVRKSVSFVDQEDLVNKEVKNTIKGRKESEDIEDLEEEVLKIEFSHSENNAVTKSDDDSIKTPADICRTFLKAKSNLKRSPNDIPVKIASPDYSTEEEDDEEACTKYSTYETVVKDIKERDLSLKVEASKVDEETRPVSRFKKERKLKM